MNDIYNLNIYLDGNKEEILTELKQITKKIKNGLSQGENWEIKKEKIQNILL